VNAKGPDIPPPGSEGRSVKEKAPADNSGKSKPAREKPVEKAKAKEKDPLTAKSFVKALQGAVGDGRDSGRDKRGAPSSGLIATFVEFQTFLKEAYFEFRKITWPDRQQVIRETWSVLVLVTIITFMVWGFDHVVARVVFDPIDRMAKSIGGGLGTNVLMPSRDKREGK
jgi:preprotein translocase SecE subunit